MNYIRWFRSLEELNKEELREELKTVNQALHLLRTNQAMGSEQEKLIEKAKIEKLLKGETK